MDSDLGKFYKPVGRPSHILSAKPLGVSNCTSSFERKSGFDGSLFKAYPPVRKTLFESKNKENEELTLCKDFLSNKEVTGKTPIAVPNKVKSGTHSDETKDGRRPKPRRSMLGLRSKNLIPAFNKDESSYTISKPLQSSSPVYNDRTNTRLLKAASTPTLHHPFDSEDADGSSFFSQGLSDSAWSVFKPSKPAGKKHVNSESFPTETPLSRGGPKSVCNNKPSEPTAEQRRKLQLLALKFQGNESLTSNSPENPVHSQQVIKNKETIFEERYLEKAPVGKAETQNHILGARTRAQLKREKEKFFSSHISNESIEDYEHQAKDSSVTETNDSSPDSNDSYIHNEATIIGTCIKKLPDIDEECLSKMTISDKGEEEAEHIDGSDEYLSSHGETDDSQHFGNIIKLFHDLRKEKDEIDYMLTDLMQKKISFDEKWDLLTLALNTSFTNSNNTHKKKSKVILDKPKHNKVICTKARRSLMSPSASLALSKSSKTDFKNYGDLKANFTSLKTPNKSTKQLRRLRKSVCYTPNSLSVLVGDQVKDIFGEM